MYIIRFLPPCTIVLAFLFGTCTKDSSARRRCVLILLRFLTTTTITQIAISSATPAQPPITALRITGLSMKFTK